MLKLFNILIVTFIFIFIILTNVSPLLAQPTSQNTKGPNSPVIYTGKGDVKVSITINEIENICKTLREYVEDYKNKKDIEISDLKKRIAKIHETEINVLPEEADKWADQFISTLPLRKDKITTKEDAEKKEFEKEKISIPLLFEYIIKKFDDYILALKRHDKSINVKQEQFPEIFVYSDSSTPRKLRLISFPNGSSLEVTFVPGLIINDKFRSYPKLYISEIKNGQKYDDFLVMHAASIFGGGNILMYNNGELTEQFKKDLTKRYDLLIEKAYLR